MEEIAPESDSSVSKKPKFHIWNKILVEDELAEALGSSMNCHGFPQTIRPKKRKKNKKKKNKNKNKTEPDDQPNQNSQKVQNDQKGQNMKKKKKPRRSRGLPYDFLGEEARKICNRLKEKRIDLIIRSIKFLGLNEVNKLCSEVMTIEEAGGLMTMNGKRRRSPGGVYFHLIKSSGRYEENIVKKILKENELKTNETTSNFAKAKKLIRSREIKPELPKDIKPNVTQDVKPDLPQNIESNVPQNIEPVTPQDIKPDVVQDIPLRIAENRSEPSQDVKMEPFQDVKMEPFQDEKMQSSSENQDDELFEPNLCIVESPLIISEAIY